MSTTRQFRRTFLMPAIAVLDNHLHTIHSLEVIENILQLFDTGGSDRNPNRNIGIFFAGLQLYEIGRNLAGIFLYSTHDLVLKAAAGHADYLDRIETGKFDLWRFFLFSLLAILTQLFSHRLAREHITKQQSNPIYEALQNASLFNGLHCHHITLIENIII